MAEFEFVLQAAPRLGGVDETVGTIRIRERDDLAIVSVSTPLGGEAALADALLKNWGLAAPSARISTLSAQTRAVRATSDQLLLIFSEEAHDAERRVQEHLSGAGYTTDQTDNWVVLEVSGARISDALERLSPLDLSLAAFTENASARTKMEHMGVLVVRLGDDSFLLMSASSSAESFLHAVEVSARNVQ